jgi:hypothetical protein
MPLFFLIVGSIGFMNLFINIKKEPYLFPIFVQFLLLPILGSINNSVFYDGTRHTLFCVPIIVLFSGIGLNILINAQVTSNLFNVLKNILFFLLIMILSLLILDLVKINPYQYSYFNELYRVLYHDKKIDNDYWLFSYREAYDDIARINKSKVDYITYYPDWPWVVVPYVDESRFLTGSLNNIDDSKKFYLIGSLRLIMNINDYITGSKLDCIELGRVQRRLMFLQEPIIMSEIFECKKLKKKK